MRIRVKVCGIRTRDDALIASAAGADAVGFILAPARRQITLEQARAIAAALPPFVTTVGVFVDAPADEVHRVACDLRLGAVQLHGDETPETCAALAAQGHVVIKAFRIAGRADPEWLATYAGASAVLLDTYVEGIAGGTGKAFSWDLAAGLGRRFRVIAAGGLTPDNVTRALDVLCPYGVDVTSGVETDGRKDPAKVEAFVEQVRSWERRQAAPRLPG